MKKTVSKRTVKTTTKASKGQELVVAVGTNSAGIYTRDPMFDGGNPEDTFKAVGIPASVSRDKKFPVKEGMSQRVEVVLSKTAITYKLIGKAQTGRTR